MSTPIRSHRGNRSLTRKICSDNRDHLYATRHALLAGTLVKRQIRLMWLRFDEPRRIIDEVHGFDRVLYDITPRPGPSSGSMIAMIRC